MKIGRIHTKSRILKVLLGLAAAGALLFASCQNIFDAAEKKTQDSGYGTVIVDLGDAARTARPDLGGTGTSVQGNGAFQRIEYKFTAYDETTGEKLEIVKTWDTSTNTGGSQAFLLPAGKYKLSVVGYSAVSGAGGTLPAANGEYKGTDGGDTFPVTGGVPITIRVVLTPVEIQTQLGNLTVKVRLPPSSDYIFKLQKYTGVADNPLEDVAGVIAYATSSTGSPVTIGGITYPFMDVTVGSYTPVTGSATNGKIPLVPGSYLFSGKINYKDTTDADSKNHVIKYGGFSEAVHIVSNIDTAFTKDFVDPSKDGPLATVANSDEAIKILVEQIGSWLTPTPATVNVLASVDGIKNIPAATAGDYGTIQMNYIGSKMKELTSSTLFPLTLQGGWSIASDSWMATNDPWNVPNDNQSWTYNIVNTLVNVTRDSGGAITAYNTRYKVEFRPVIELRVKYGMNGSTQVDSSNRGITIKDGGGTDLTLQPADKTKERKAIAPVAPVAGVTSIPITIDNAAILVDGVSAIPPTATPTVYTLQAKSQVYNIEIWEDAATQTSLAFDRLRSDIAGVRTGSTPWVQDMNALTRVGFQDDSKDVWPTSPVDGKNDTILYYVADRLANKPAASSGGDYLFEIRTPGTEDIRWKPLEPIKLGTEGTVTDPTKVTNSVGVVATITFVPWGGTDQVYYVVLKPVAEFRVDFNPDNITPSGGGSPYDIDPAIESGASVLIEDSDTPTKHSGTYTTSTDKNTSTRPGRFFILGNNASSPATIDITLDKVSILIDEWDPNGISTGVGSFKDKIAWKSSTGANNKNSDIVQGNAQAYKLSGAVSRVYTIKVYPSLMKQQSDAVNRLATLRDTDTATRAWFDTTTSGTVNPSRIVPFSRVTAGGAVTTADPPNPLPSSTIIYVGSSSGEPTIAFPAAAQSTSQGNYTFNSTNGWNTISQSNAGTAGTTTNLGSKDVTIKFTPKAGVEADLYTFKLVRAIAYSITFADMPIGSASPVGTISVKGQNPGIPTPTHDESYPASGKGTGNSVATLPLIGVGATIQIGSADTANPNVLTRDNGTTFVTSLPNITVADGESQIDIIVYPPISTQVGAVTAALKALNSLEGWGTGTRTTVDVTVDTGTNATKSTFKIIGDLPGGTVNAPSSFQLNTAYVGSGSYGSGKYFEYSPGTGPDLDNQKGVRVDTVKFVAIGGTAAASGAATPSSSEVWYKFELQSVARYNVVFQPGPNGGTSYQGSLKFKTFVPGLGTLPTASTGTLPTGTANVNLTADSDQFVEIAQVGPKSFLGGVTFTSATTAATLDIKSPNGTVYVTNIKATDGTIDATQLAVSNADITQVTGSKVTSADYTIWVYPTQTEQVRQAREILKGKRGPLLNNTSGSNSDVGWLSLGTGVTTSNLVGTELFDAGDNISEIQYFGTKPTVKVPTVNNGLATGSTINYAFTVNLTTAPIVSESDGWEKTPILFRPVGPALSTPEIYHIRTIPVVKFVVQFAGQAVGKITISPSTAAVDPSGTMTITRKPKDPIIVQRLTPGTDVLEVVDYLGLGYTKFKMEAPENGFATVDSIGSSSTPTLNLTPDASETGTSTKNNLNMTTTSSTYTLRVFK